MAIQKTVYDILIITAIVAFLIIYISHKIDRTDPLSKPSCFITLVISLVETVTNMVTSSMGKKKALLLTPYILVLWLYIFISNISGLFGIDSPTANFSVTILLSFLTWLLIQIVIFKYNGVKAYFASFLDPLPVMLPMNIIGKFSTMFSMALRLFGNITCGSLVMQLVYYGAQNLSNGIAKIFGLNSVFNFVAPFIAPILHLYFDLFAGFIQTLVFVMLTIVLIGNEIPDIEKN